MKKIKKYLYPSGTLPVTTRRWQTPAGEDQRGLEGNLFENSGDTEDDATNIFRRPDGSYFYSEDGIEERDITPLNTALGNNPAYWTYTDAEGRIYTPRHKSPSIDQGEITQGEEPSFFDKFLAFSNKHYFNSILGAPARAVASWKNNTDPVKALWNSPFVAVNPYVLGAKTISNLASENGIPKTIRLYNNSDGSYADRWAWQRSLVGDISEASMLLPAAFKASADLGEGIQFAGTVLSNANKHGKSAYLIAKDVAARSNSAYNWRNAASNTANNQRVFTWRNLKNWRDFRFLGDKRFYSDLDNMSVSDILKERDLGIYPLTFAERRLYVTGLKGDIQKGIDYAKQEAVKNVKAPIKGITSYLDMPTVKTHFGTLRATNRYGKTPWEGDYGAFLNKDGLFFPFRDRPNTLRTHTMFLDAGERVETGAHEARHAVLSYFGTPLVDYFPGRGNYGRFTNSKLPVDFKWKVNSYINDAETAGEWKGSLAEMDAELTGWSAKYNLPRYSEMSPVQKARIHDLFQRRFGGNTDYANYNIISALLNQKKLPVNNSGEVLDNSKIGQIIQGLENLGYRKEGGKI